MNPKKLKPGDPVVYRKTKHSPTLGTRAYGIHPQAHGDDYSYSVDKYWRVGKILEDGRILVYTRRGKQHVCQASDRNLHKPGFLEYLRWQHKFPPAEVTLAAKGETEVSS